MNKKKLEQLIKINEQVLNETELSDIAQCPKLHTKIIHKVYSESLVSDIADVQQMKGPVGKVATLFSSYTGEDSSGVKETNSIVLRISDITGYVVGSTISSVTGEGTIEYIEGDNDILVKVTTGYFAKGQTTIENLADILSAISNRTYAARIFSNYSGPLLDSEHTQTRNIDYSVVMKTIEAKTRRIKSRITREAIDDMKAMYGLDIAEDIIANEFGSEAIQEIDQEIIEFLKGIATPSDDVVLASSYGIQGDIMALGNDIYANIFNCANAIARDTKRRQNFFILCDPTSMALLQTNPLHISPEMDKTNNYFMGYLGSQFKLYLDPYTSENYVLIGYSNLQAGTGDSGLIYAPYYNNIVESTEFESGNPVYHNILRYGYIQHPQDTGTGAADSIFFRTFKVNASGITNFKQI